MQKGKTLRPQTLRPRRTLLPFPEPLEARRFLSASAHGTAQPNLTVPLPAATTAAASGAIAGYTPAQIRQAYGVDQVPGNGLGQTIAIVDAYNDPNIKSDLDVFDAQFGINAPPSLNVVSQTGGNPSKISSDPAWSTEVALDVEWAHAIAPGANILLVEAKNSNLTNLLAGVEYAKNVADVSVVSMSWGGSEFSSETKYDNLFTTPAGHTGITFVAATGDRGAFFGAEWPASSPNVLSVGGTTLQPNATNGGQPQETPWAQSTSGKSTIEREPAYQHTAQQTGSRIIPDVALNADPNTGYAVYDSVSNNGKSGWQVVGGTSAAAPQWGGLIAIADQLRIAANLGTLDGVSQTLPAIYLSAADPATYSANFNAITAAFYSAHGGPSAGSDSGLGTPKAAMLIETLAQQPSNTLIKPSFLRADSASGGGDTHETPAALGSAPSVGSAAQASQQGIATASASTPAPVPPPSSILPAPAQSPTVFNDAPIHQAGAALSVSGPGRIELTDGAGSQRSSALALANATAFSGELSAGLATWLAGNNSGPSDGNDLTFGMAHNSVAAAIAAAFPIATGAISPADVVAVVSGPLVHGPASILYRFANFDPVGTFADSLADFARESASVGPMEMKQPSHRALIVTMVVIGVDTMLAANWYNARKKARKQATATNPESPQAGPLPTGL